MTLLNDIQVWTTACAFDHLISGRGVGVLLDDGSQAALFRLDDGSLYALGNVDPFSGAAVLSRGIVGDRGGRATRSDRRSSSRLSHWTTVAASMTRACRCRSTRSASHPPARSRSHDWPHNSPALNGQCHRRGSAASSGRWHRQAGLPSSNGLARSVFRNAGCPVPRVARRTATPGRRSCPRPAS